MAENQSEQEIIERRKAFRLDMEKELVDIVWQNASGDEQRKKIVCVDFSKGGLKLDCDQEIAVQTAVKIHFKAAEKNSQLLHGRIIRCQKQVNGWYEIALRLDD